MEQQLLFDMKAHGFTPKPLEKLLEIIGNNYGKIERIRKRDYQTLYKYHLLTVINHLSRNFSRKRREEAWPSSFQSWLILHLPQAS